MLNGLAEAARATAWSMKNTIDNAQQAAPKVMVLEIVAGNCFTARVWRLDQRPPRLDLRRLQPVIGDALKPMSAAVRLVRNVEIPSFRVSRLG